MTSPPRRIVIAAGAMCGLAAAGAARFLFHQADLATHILQGALLLGIPLVGATVRGLLRRHFAADIVAALAIVGSALLGEYLAGVIVVLMQAGGEAMDAYAMRRASQSLEALLERAPSQARRRRAGVIEDIRADAVVAGDELVLRPGDMVPVDCVVTDGRSAVDESALTGEPRATSATAGVTLSSGGLNLDGALIVRALRPAGQSQYQQIVRLVEQARADKAPIQRLADRYAVWFTPATLLMCLVAWLVDHQMVSVLAVLVVATPCPLILATPVAVVAGIGRAARRGIIVRHGGAIEEAGRAVAVVFDKTGTLTLGAPTVSGVTAAAGHAPDDVLRWAAAVEQFSSHHLGQAIAAEGRTRFGSLPDAAGFQETPGLGVEGVVEGHRVAVGAGHWLPCGTAAPASGSGTEVCVDGARAGSIAFADRLRAEAPAVIRELRAMGIQHIAMLSGDQRAAADAIAGAAGIETVHAELLPGDKVTILDDLRRRHGRVIMVGDGINDAPALASASVGIAMGAHAPAAAAQAADIVLLVDDIGRVAETIAISRRTRRVALQSIGVGLGVSGALMVVAAFGHIAPAVGALLQEGLDAAVILNALRARR